MRTATLTFPSTAGPNSTCSKTLAKEDFRLLPAALTGGGYGEGEVKEFVARYNWEKFKLPGHFNRENLFVAHHLARAFLSPIAPSTQELIETFTGPPHRMEYLGRWRNLCVYNDAKSTNEESTRRALDCFDPEEPIYLIWGGQGNRGIPSEFCGEVPGSFCHRRERWESGRTKSRTGPLPQGFRRGEEVFAAEGSCGNIAALPGTSLLRSICQLPGARRAI